MQTIVDIIFLAIITIFIFINLFKTFGKIDFQDLHDIKIKLKPIEVEVISDLETKLTQDARNALDAFRKQGNDFIIENFLEGAKKAFKLISKAFTESDKSTLRELLSDEVYIAFLNEITKRENSNIVLIKDIHDIKEISMLDAFTADSVINIKVKIQSLETSYIKDKFGNLIEGDSERSVISENIWTFCKDIKKDCNTIWKLVDTNG